MPDDQSELIKAGIDSALRPFADLLDKLAGPLATEIGQTFGDAARVYRFKRALKLLQKVEKLARESGFEPRPVSPKLLLPILDHASLEDDEVIHDRWAFMLANAANPDFKSRLSPSFIHVLDDLSKEEVLFLDRLYSEVEERCVQFDGMQPDQKPPRHPIDDLGDLQHLHQLYRDANCGIPETELNTSFAITMVNLSRLKLVDGPRFGQSRYFLSPFSCAFANACRIPSEAITEPTTQPLDDYQIDLGVLP